MKRTTIVKLATAALLAAAALAARAAAPALADQPLAAGLIAPGNVLLALSVEFPTAQRAAHTDPVYSRDGTYLGYFDPNKCYRYVVQLDTTTSYFRPAGLASGDGGSGHQCLGANDDKWSGNFLNWASTPTIDPFRSVMTGGHRVVDSVGTTILQKAWHPNMGAVDSFPDRDVPAGEIQGATPFSGSSLRIRIKGQGFKMRLTGNGARFTGTYYNTRNLSGPVVLTRNDDTLYYDWGTASPGPGVNRDNFSVRWTTTFVAPSTGTYTFGTWVDDGVRVHVAPGTSTSWTPVIDRWTEGAALWNEGTIALTAGQTYTIRMEYFEFGGPAAAELWWLPPGSSWTPMSDSPTLAVPYDGKVSADLAAIDLTMRVQVCDPTAGNGGVEGNCKRYSDTNWKPEGLMQQYASKLRFSAFGYLNDHSLWRDGGVMRARQKFVGPTYPVPGEDDRSNPGTEWSSTTGIFVTNPDSADATATGVSRSGVINYMNGFGQYSRSANAYKFYDPASELYYSALRYLRNVGDVPEYSSLASSDAALRAQWIDGFPVITNWDDPLLYACQKNFILGIGDTNTNADKNLPGSPWTWNEPTMPQKVRDDVSVLNVYNETRRVEQLEGITGLSGSATLNSWGGIAGMAWWANTADIRPDVASKPNTVGRQSAQTYWVDVLETGFAPNNAYYNAAKYGGFAVPDGFDRRTATGLREEWWWTTDSWISDASGSNWWGRPDTYFTAGDPASMASSLTEAFSKIDRDSRPISVASIATATPQLSASGNASYASRYSAGTWTSTLTASELSFDANGKPVRNGRWEFAGTLDTQAGFGGWDDEQPVYGRRIVTWKPTVGGAGGSGVPFRAASLGAEQLAALDTDVVAGSDGAGVVDYLRGDRSQENLAGEVKTGLYRHRSALLGDITDAQLAVVGPPSRVLSDAANPGYSKFRKDRSGRPTMVYAAGNGGMLHAIDGRLEGEGAGFEVFAYVPGALYQGPGGEPQVSGLAALARPGYVHRHYVNATPVAFDVDLKRTPDKARATGEGPDWRTVLIGGLGKGGRSWYALDVTDPAALASSTETQVAGKVMWEFGDPTMGYSYGRPVVVKTKRYGWVAILTSGYGGPAGSSYFYVVDPSSGRLLQRVATPASVVSNGLAQAEAYVADGTDMTADAVYAGDLEGNLWRLDLTATSGDFPAPLRVAVLTDAGGKLQPITSRPLIEIEPGTENRWVLVGTGRLLGSDDPGSTDGQSYYGLRDGTRNAFWRSGALPTGISHPYRRSALAAVTDLSVGTRPSATQPGWRYDLGSGGWRFTGEATAYNGTVLFPAINPAAAVCQTGQTRVHALAFGSGQSQLPDRVAYLPVDGTVTAILVNQILTGPSDKPTGSTIQITGTTDRDETIAIPRPPGAAGGVRRVNWREVPVAN